MLSDYLKMIKGFILVIGPSEAGKTSILRRLITGTFEEQDPTLGFREETIAKVRIIEIGGQENFKKYWKQALEQKPVHIFFTIDVTKENDFFEYNDFLQRLKEELSQQYEEITLIANKMDLIPEIPDYIPKNKFLIQSSAKTGEGLLDILERIATFKDKAEATISFDKDIWNQNEHKDKSEQEISVDEVLKRYEGKF